MNVICKYLVFMILLIGFAGCATPYKKVGGFQFHDLGYSDQQISKNEYKIKYFGYEWEGDSRLKELWHKRAAELCPHGYSTGEFKNKMKHRIEFDYPIPHVNKFPYVEGIATCKE